MVWNKSQKSSLKDILKSTAKSMRNAFPGYANTTLFELMFGIATVAVQHHKKNLLATKLENPKLFTPQETDFDYSTLKKYPSELNPDGIDSKIIQSAQSILDLVIATYYPLVEYQSQYYAILTGLKPKDGDILASLITHKSADEKSIARRVGTVVLQNTKVHHGEPAFFTTLEDDRLTICVRGTWSASDMISNFTSEQEEFYAFRSYDGGRELIKGSVHSGMLASAKWVFGKHLALLDDILSEKKKIICCGHSAGGAIATLVAILIRDFMVNNIEKMSYKPLPSVQCITFASSAFFSYDLARWCRSFTDSFIMAGDIVPCFTTANMEQLRLEIQDPSSQAVIDEYKQRHPFLSRVLFKKTTSDEKYSFEPMYPAGNIYMVIDSTDSEDVYFGDEFFEYLSKKIDKAEKPKSFMKLAKAFRERISGDDVERTFVIRHIDAKHLDRIVFSPCMIRHHWTYNFNQAFLFILK